MTPRKRRQNRRDRRKAKASGFTREGTKNPKKVGHHVGTGFSVPSTASIKCKKLPPLPALTPNWTEAEVLADIERIYKEAGMPLPKRLRKPGPATEGLPLPEHLKENVPMTRQIKPLLFEFEKNIVFSTGHIPQTDTILLDRDAASKTDCLLVYKYPEGYFVYSVPGDENDDQFLETMHQAVTLGYSSALRRLLDVARDNGAKFLHLDRDGPVYPQFPKFDW